MTEPGATKTDSSDVNALEATLDATADDAGPAPRDQASVESPSSREIGRYVVLERLGAGAMGVVLAAYDPELDRKVALKLLHPHRRSHQGDGHLRLLAEAQALARLSDPNVVAVHDVGTHEGQVFVAMEFVEGQTLGHWLAKERRSFGEVLDVMLHAGRGLAAAHARELVHRDFKPDNLMIDDNGRVRVMDFGLARAHGDPTTGSVELETSQPRQRALELALTNDGALTGTPAYMAPECFEGGRGDAATDQFAFCVTLWEGLYGQSPFPAQSIPELYARILDGDIAEPPISAGVPRWLRRVVERGLAVSPAQRWPSMQALLHALERGRVRARYRRGLGVVAVAGVAAAIILGASHYDRLRKLRACEQVGASIDQVWNDGVAAAVREALVGTGAPSAGLTMDKAQPWLDAQANAWATARTETCVRAEVDEIWDGATYERARWCLDDRRMELEALVAELHRGDARMVAKVVPAAAGLNQVSPCLDAAMLARMPTGPAEQREQLRAVRAEQWRLQALDAVGEHDEALALAREVLDQAEALGWPPLMASSRVYLGGQLADDAQYAEAERMLEQAYFEASEAEALETAYIAASRLVGLVGYKLARHQDALRWARHAKLVFLRVPEASDVARAPLLVDLSSVHFTMGDYERAQELAEQVREIYEEELGHHPRVADALTNLGLYHQARGDYARAKELYEEALELDEQMLGPLHPVVANIAANLGTLELQLGNPTRAKMLFERVLSIREATNDPDHPDVADALNNLASLHQILEEHELAQPLYERALGIYESTLEPDHPSIAATLNNLADALRKQGSLDRAQELFQRALRTYEAKLGQDHPDLSYPLQGLSSIAFERGRFDDAVTLAERALRLRQESGVGSDYVAEVRFELAKARWAQGVDLHEAVAQARRTVEEYREHGGAHADELAEVEKWLSEHPLPPEL